jgi:hypothetical protein
MDKREAGLVKYTRIIAATTRKNQSTVKMTARKSGRKRK